MESQRYNIVDKDWRRVMKNANANPEVCALMKASADISNTLELHSHRDCVFELLFS